MSLVAACIINLLAVRCAYLELIRAFKNGWSIGEMSIGAGIFVDDAIPID